jgi:hypothetical protein
MVAIADIKKPRGRPPTGRTAVLVRLLPEELELLELWSAANGGNLSRPEALRRILKLVAFRVPVVLADSMIPGEPINDR